MNSIKFIPLLLLLITSLSSNAFSGIKIYNEEHPIAIDSKDPEFKKELELLNKLVFKLNETHIKPKIKQLGKNKTEVKIEWFINKKRIAGIAKYKLSYYEGENPETTNSKKIRLSNNTNKLYFFDKPLGQYNGLTWSINKKVGSGKILKNIFKNTKVFIKVQYKDKVNFIPILTTTSKNGCGGDIFDEQPEILCLQTSQSKEGDLNIGYKQGYKNTFIYPELIKDPNEITTSLEIFYKGAKI